MLNNSSNHITLNDINKLKGPILIIGVSGFIGTNIFRTILKHRDDCYGIFHSDPNSWRLKDLPLDKLKKCDITEPDELETILNKVKPKTIFNLAAYGAYSKQKDSGKIYNTNFMSTCNILNLIKDKNIIYIHAGSSSEYGINCDTPEENAKLEPNSDYAVSKVACSYLIQYYGKVLNVPAINLRLYSIYGEWEEPDRLIPRLLITGMEGKYPPFVDPEISRDFVYIEDAICAFVVAALKSDEYKGESFNIGTGEKTLIKDLAEYSKNYHKISADPIFANMDNRKWDLENWVANPQKAIECLNWHPKTSLNEGLKNTSKWLENYADFYKTFNSDEKKATDKISAIITCYKDEQAIPIMYERLVTVFKKLNIDYEIIFVNDCSPDNSEKAIFDISCINPNVIGITHSRNFGSQSAFLSGLEICTGNAAVFLDGDLQDPPELIENFYYKWKENYDVVYGERVKREMSPINEFCYKAFYAVFSKLADIKIPRDAGDFSLIDRKVINELLLLEEKDVFLRGLRAWVGFNQIGVPYIRPERLFGKSSNNLFKNIWWAKKGIFSFSQKPLELISYLSLIVFFITVITAIIQFLVRIFHPEWVPPGLTTIILLILFLGGIQLLAISIIGEYIIKIVEETKKRPRYIRKSIITANRKLEDSKDIEDFIKKRLMGKS